MNFSRQALLGIGMIVGGSVMLYAMVQQIGTTNDPEVAAIVEQPVIKAPAPLTTDIETEKRLLAQKQKERAARAAEQERRAKEFSAEQESAEAKALAKSQAENEQYIANSAPAAGDSDSPEAAQTSLVTPKVQTRANTAVTKPNTDSQKTAQQNQAEAEKRAAVKKKAEAEEQAAIRKQTQALSREADKKLADTKKKAEDEKAAALKKKQEQAAKDEAAKAQPPKSASDYKVKSGDALSKIARQHNVSVSALAQANKISPSSSLQIGQALTIPSPKQIERLEREAAAEKKAAEDKLKKEQTAAKLSADAQENLRAARQQVKDTDAKGNFGVQVALATNQNKANEVVKKYEAAGYKVKTINVGTGRGVRVIVGPERGKIAALALKDKVNSDASVNANGAWVRYWD